MLILCEKRRKFSIGARIVWWFSRNMAWAAIVTSAQKVSYDLRLHRGIAVRVSAFNNPLYWTVGQKENDMEQLFCQSWWNATGR